jgi:hypothetical protein
MDELNKVPQVFIKFDVMFGEYKFTYYMYIGKKKLTSFDNFNNYIINLLEKE